MPGEEDKPQDTTVDATTEAENASHNDENTQQDRAGRRNMEDDAQRDAGDGVNETGNDGTQDEARRAKEARPVGETGENVGGSTSTETGGAGADDAASAEAGSAAAASNADDEKEQLQARVQELEAENSSLKDQYLRKQAEFENFRKRMTKEKADAISYANQQLLQDVIQIIDDFERAIKSSEESRDFDAFHDGVALIEKQFTSMLERKWGLQRFDSEGEEFDPQKHEAVTTEEVEDDGETRVLEEYQKGYFLHDRVLRSAKVKVSVPKSS